MDVHLDDPAARQRRMGWLRAGGLALAFGASFLAALPHVAWLAPALVVIGFETFFLAPLVLRLGAGSQAGTLTLHPGRVVVETRRGRTVLRARDLYGATTAYEPGTERIVLTLSLGRFRAYPVSLTFASVAEMESVRRALGVGQQGRGVVWIAGGRANAGRSFFRGCLFVLAALAPLFVYSGVGGAVFLSFLALGGLMGDLWNSETFKLWGDRIVVGTGPGRDEWTYANVRRVQEDPGGLSFTGVRGGGFGRVAMPSGWLAPFSDHERELLVAQVKAAVARSRAEPPMPTGVGESLTNLRRLRAQGERPASWLSRLDAVAALSDASHAGAGYREASLDVDALWSTLEDPDADLELRCAAARILHRRRSARAHDKAPEPADEAIRVRIATAVESVGDAPARARLRIMTEDEPHPDELEETFEPKPRLAQKLV